MGRAGTAGRGAGCRRPPQALPSGAAASSGSEVVGALSGGGKRWWWGTQDDVPENGAAVAGGCAKTEGWGDDGIARRGEGSALAGPDRNLGGRVPERVC